MIRERGREGKKRCLLFRGSDDESKEEFGISKEK
jgi:hypothetical protein